MLKLERIITFTLIVAASVFAVVNWRRAALFQQQNEQWAAKLATMEAETTRDSRSATARAEEMEVLKQRSAELMKLRNEVTQLRASNQVAQAFSAENERLKAQIQQLRRQPGAAAAQVAEAAGPGEQIPREKWNFAGYTTPESALVSALWSMKEGDPLKYLESLSPAEQERVAKNWETMSADQIAAKHKSDVANITSMRVLDRQNLAPDEIVMNVFLEGPGRMEKVRMNQVGQEWKFSGFVREPAAVPDTPPVPPTQ